MTETISSETNTVCRTCLTGNSEIYNIKQTKYENVKLTEMLDYFAAVVKVEVSDSNKLPQNMCKSCITSLYNSYKFLKTCEKVQTDLELRLALMTSEQNNELVQITFKQELITVDGEEYPVVLILPSDQMKIELDKENGIETTLIDTQYNSRQNEVLPNDHSYFGINNASCLSDENDNGNDITDTGGGSKISDTDICEKITTVKALTTNDLPTSTTNNELVISNSESMESKNKVVKSTRGSGQIQGPPFVCIACDALYDDYESLMNHKRELGHRGRSYLCEYCSRRIPSFTHYQQHILKHTGEKPHKCTLCDKAYNSTTGLKRHFTVHTGEKPFVCNVCNKAYRRKEHLEEHDRTHTGKKLICLFCGKGFNNLSTLNLHEKKHKIREEHLRIENEGATADGDEPKNVRCPICNKLFLSEGKLKVHKMVGHAPKNLKCDKCDKAYSTKMALSQHKRIVHRDLRFPCLVCNKVFKRKPDVSGHMRTHQRDNVVFRCDECPKEFKYRGSLDDHKRSHTGDTTYQCQECFQICRNGSALKSHILIHTGEKPFSCKDCGRSFTQKSNLAEHAKTHASKNHHCTVCERAYYTVRSLRKHMRLHHHREGAKNVENTDK